MRSIRPRPSASACAISATRGPWSRAFARSWMYWRASSGAGSTPGCRDLDAVVFRRMVPGGDDHPARCPPPQDLVRDHRRRRVALAQECPDPLRRQDPGHLRRERLGQEPGIVSDHHAALPRAGNLGSGVFPDRLTDGANSGEREVLRDDAAPAGCVERDRAHGRPYPWPTAEAAATNPNTMRENLLLARLLKKVQMPGGGQRAE